jgi:type IX secretion system PorP/SprF family membrane protein
MKKISFILLGLVSLNLELEAQQEAQYSMYFFNPMLINPGYTGTQEALQVTALVRDQYTNFKGAPKTQGLSLHAPLRNQHIGLGVTLTNDKLGATNNTAGYGFFAYSIKLNAKNHRLVFGLKAGTDFYRSDYSNATVEDNSDYLFVDGYNFRKTLFNVGTGVYYYGKRFYAGASVPSLVKNSIAESTGQKAVQENHFYAFAGVVIKINPGINFRPSFVIKTVKNAPPSIDANAALLFYNKVWFGLMYRYNSAAGANIMYNVSENFRIGYAYDYGLNTLQKYSNGSHEIMLGFDLRTVQKGIKSPRFF